MPHLELSQHAEKRAQQRGVPSRLLSLLVEHADVDAPAGAGCRLLRVSRDGLRDRSVRATVGADADRLARLAVVWSDVTSSVVTVLHHHRGAVGRRYRATH